MEEGQGKSCRYFCNSYSLFKKNMCKMLSTDLHVMNNIFFQKLFAQLK